MRSACLLTAELTFARRRVPTPTGPVSRAMAPFNSRPRYNAAGRPGADTRTHRSRRRFTESIKRPASFVASVFVASSRDIPILNNSLLPSRGHFNGRNLLTRRVYYSNFRRA